MKFAFTLATLIFPHHAPFTFQISILSFFCFPFSISYFCLPFFILPEKCVALYFPYTVKVTKDKLHAWNKTG
jgi:hypothetical protein